MYDRVPASGQEGRVKITPEGGAAYYAKVEMADNPSVAGTPLNKLTLLTDAVAALYGLDAAAVPNDVLSAARTLIQTAQTTANGRARIATGSYTGTGTYGNGNPNTLTFGFTPKIVFIRKAPEIISGGYAGAKDAFAVFSQTASNVSEDYPNTATGKAGGFAGTLYIPGNTYPYAYRLKGKLVNNTLTWCNTDSAGHQANTEGEIYYWTAIG